MANEKQLNSAKSYEEIDFTNDFMFGKIMEDSNLCREVIERLLNRPIGELKEVIPQKKFKQTSDGKEIRLDIYTKDNEAVYDAEMQNLGNMSIDSLNLPRRSRFYQSEIDADFLYKGATYRSLPENNVIFICTFDPFGKNEPFYLFENYHKGREVIPLKDGTYKYFFNCAYHGEEISKELSDFYNYIRTGKATDKLTEKIETAVENGRKNERWRSEYMKERLIKDDYIQEGIAIGKKEQQEKLEKAEQRADAEKQRADSERQRADNAEKENKRLRQLLLENNIKI
ncbi:MAG: Rpn family recombination-promoting nuclease/putative transposase [Lachnospiraceae bacterium]|nr:Rpn family recombination-promoting nuclease/putative transposase [Lachnospiraceae bacterium]